MSLRPDVCPAYSLTRLATGEPKTRRLRTYRNYSREYSGYVAVPSERQAIAANSWILVKEIVGRVLSYVQQCTSEPVIEENVSSVDRIGIFVRHPATIATDACAHVGVRRRTSGSTDQSRFACNSILHVNFGTGRHYIGQSNLRPSNRRR